MKKHISFEKFFRKFIKKVKSKKLKDLYLLKAKNVKQNLQTIWDKIEMVLLETGISLDEFFDIYLKRKGDLNLKEFTEEWEHIILEELINRKKKAQIILNYLMKKGSIRDPLKFPKDYKDFLLFHISKKENKNKR